MNGKCTVSRGLEICCRGRLAAGEWLAALVCGSPLVAGVPVTQADFEQGHEGLTGRHRLADINDSSGAVGDIVLPGHDSLGETWLRVNPPIKFAIDLTETVDEQQV